jgi:hypothetical protein
MNTDTEKRLAARRAAKDIINDVFKEQIVGDRESRWLKFAKKIGYNYKDIIIDPDPMVIETDSLEAAFNQASIDYCLKLIVKPLLNRLFKHQKAIREQIDRVVVRGDSESVPRNLMRNLLEEELNVAAEINLWKERFDKLIEAAKIWGYEVFERNENRYHIYRSLEVSFRAIVEDRKNNDLSPA